jgi:CBS domain-containing protein
MLIRDMLKLKGPKVETVAPDASLREAVRIACERHIGSLLVVDGGRLVGIITERDILRQVHARADFDTTPVATVMSRDVVIGLPEDDIQRAMNTMTERRVRHLPVLEGGQVKGIISIGDVVSALREEEEVEIRFLRDYISQ